MLHVTARAWHRAEPQAPRYFNAPRAQRSVNSRGRRAYWSGHPPVGMHPGLADDLRWWDDGPEVRVAFRPIARLRCARHFRGFRSVEVARPTDDLIADGSVESL